jgi:hypothetical protein
MSKNAQAECNETCSIAEAPPLFEMKSQRPQQRVKSESLLSGSFERQGLRDKVSKTATASKERKLAFKLFRALANGQDTIIPSTHRLRVNLVIEPLGIGLFSLSFRSFFLATIDYFVIDL